MRSILTIVIACSLLPWFPLVAKSTKPSPQGVNLVSEAEKSQPPVKKTVNQPVKLPIEKPRKSETLDFSATGRPGQQTAGESRGSCDNAMEPIRAMIPESNSGKTVMAHPRFWVYFPQLGKETKEAKDIEFVIQDEARKDVWRSRSPSTSTLTSSANYQSFVLPATEAPLQIGQWYRWYVKVYCHDQVASVQYVQGWIKRIPLTAELHLELQKNSPKTGYLAYGNHQIWYDAIDQLLSSYQNNPKSLTLEQDWQNLIRAKGVKLEQLPPLEVTRISKH
ncbi:MAG: hypothetical protein RLZZ04_449 [Cyanobacteriota bacterium]|jgi:hypothetical protein